MVDRLFLGAPGIYHQPAEPIRALTGARMDVCAFAGVAPRGPARVRTFHPEQHRWVSKRSVAVAVESWDEYRRLYGSFGGPGLLPYAVASFFEQGGHRAYVIRIVHGYDDPALDEGGVAMGTIPGLEGPDHSPVRLRARDEGSWGNRLRAAVAFSPRPLVFVGATPDQIVLDARIGVPVGSLLRLTAPDGARALRFVSNVATRARPAAWGRDRVLTLEIAAPFTPQRAEVVEAQLVVEDSDPQLRRTEQHDGLGLSAGHPRAIADVLFEESTLLRPDPGWIDADIRPTDPELPRLEATPFEGGTDRYRDIRPSDFFDPAWLEGRWDPAADPPGDGVLAVSDLPDASLIVAPDLYSPGPIAAREPILDPGSLAGPTFEPCVVLPEGPEQAESRGELEGLRLDPRSAGELREIVRWQGELVGFAEGSNSFVALLDVPPGLGQREILAWRNAFHSSFAAAYHPWLKVAPPEAGDRLISVNPSAVAAGIVARREIAFGVPSGPANELALGVIDLDDVVSGQRHDELHQAAVNVFLRERDGVRLSAARTLARDQSYRQLSVRRLVSMLRRVLEQQTQWMVFEPNNEALRADVRNLLSGFLRQLYLAGAFKGATEDEAYFVRCDETLNPRPVIDAGELVVEVGVAPAEPLEFIVLRVTRDGDGSIRVEAPHG